MKLVCGRKRLKSRSLPVMRLASTVLLLIFLALPARAHTLESALQDLRTGSPEAVKAAVIWLIQNKQLESVKPLQKCGDPDVEARANWVILTHQLLQQAPALGPLWKAHPEEVLLINTGGERLQNLAAIAKKRPGLARAELGKQLLGTVVFEELYYPYRDSLGYGPRREVPSLPWLYLAALEFGQGGPLAKRSDTYKRTNQRGLAAWALAKTAARLQPAERKRALELLRADFPSQYREVAALDPQASAGELAALLQRWPMSAGELCLLASRGGPAVKQDVARAMLARLDGGHRSEALGVLANMVEWLTPPVTEEIALALLARPERDSQELFVLGQLRSLSGPTLGRVVTELTASKSEAACRGLSRGRMLRDYPAPLRRKVQLFYLESLESGSPSARVAGAEALWSEVDTVDADLVARVGAAYRRLLADLPPQKGVAGNFIVARSQRAMEEYSKRQRR